MKPVEELTIADFQITRVWEYVRGGETIVSPVSELPATSLQNRIVATIVRLADGTGLWATLSNMSLTDRRSNMHFLTLSVEKDGAWFHLGRYFDVDYEKRGPQQLARFLGLPVGRVFPIRYDLSDVIAADPSIVKGSIPLEPQERLCESALIALASSSSDL